MKGRFWGASLALLAGACAATPPPAVLTYVAPDCRSTPDLAAAIPLAVGRRGGEATMTAVNGTTPCLEIAGFRSPHVVYRLPAAMQDRMIEVGGMVEQVRTFPTAVSILDQNGATVRSFPRDRFLNRGGRYSVQFIPEARERYVLVTVDPELVGTSYEEIATGVSSTVIVTPYGAGTWNSGVDRAVARSRSYEGTVIATVYDTSERPPR